MMGRMINQAGLALIKSFEGLRLTSYDDGVGVWTIGYGRTGPGVKAGMTITNQQAEDFLKADLEKFCQGVERLVKVKLLDNEFAALVSFAFNVGLGAFEESTLLKKLNANDFHGAATEFARWNKGGGRVMEGLTRRRAAEMELFTKPNANSMPTSSTSTTSTTSTPTQPHTSTLSPVPMWRLISPRENWRNPVEFPGEALGAMKALCDRMGLMRTVDSDNRKFYADHKSPMPVPGKMGNLTSNFNWEEFDSHDGVKVPEVFKPNIKRIAEALEKVRKLLGGVKLVITSGYRSPEHNAAVGGVPGSEHTKGLAADVWSPELESAHGLTWMRDQIVKAARKVPEIKGLGVNYDSFVHMDVRLNSERVEW